MILTDEDIESCSNFSHNRYQFARAIESAVLSKLAEQDVAPYAWDSESIGLTFENHYSDTRPLYTESQLLAAQQRTAEACAKLCEATADKYQETESRLWPECSSDAQSGASSCEGSIRNGEWREYL